MQQYGNKQIVYDLFSTCFFFIKIIIVCNIIVNHCNEIFSDEHWETRFLPVSLDLSCAKKQNYEINVSEMYTRV